MRQIRPSVEAGCQSRSVLVTEVFLPAGKSFCIDHNAAVNDGCSC